MNKKRYNDSYSRWADKHLDKYGRLKLRYRYEWISFVVGMVGLGGALLVWFA
jgi:hypothetical protein